MRIVRREDNRLGPLETILLVHRRVADDVDRPRRNVHLFSSVVVIARDLATVRTRVDDLRIARIGGNISALASYPRIPAPSVAAAPGRAGDADGAVVLLRSIDPIRAAIVRNGMVALGRRLVRLRL